MTNKQVIERLEVMRDCYMVCFNDNGGTGYEAKYKENKEAFDIAVSFLQKVPDDARLIDANKLRSDLQLYFNEAILQGVTPETMFMQILQSIDNSPTLLGGAQ